MKRRMQQTFAVLEKGKTMSDYIKREDALEAVERADTLDEAMDNVKGDIYCPAADVAPVRHGRWVPTDESLGGHCSNCGMECSSVEWDDDYLMKPTWNYCPNCGARMDGDEDE